MCDTKQKETTTAKKNHQQKVGLKHSSLPVFKHLSTYCINAVTFLTVIVLKTEFVLVWFKQHF